MIKKRILALDLGATTGWAVCKPAVTSGIIKFTTSRDDGAGMRFLRFERWLESVLEHERFEEVYFEEVRRHLATAAAHSYGGYRAILTKFCTEHKIPYSSIPVGVVKKNFTGKGTANKEAMIEEARRKGFSPQDDNEADAIAILFSALTTLNETL